MSRTGAKILVDSLLEHGVEYVFALPGGQVLKLFDELYDAPLKVILVRHEQGAGHMADGYARATGKVGVCIATSGPGATNLVTAIATAYMDSVPVVAVTGQVRTDLIGNDAFQEADVTGITRPCTKHNYLVEDVRDLARIVNEAFYIASTGRPGPVLIDLPSDVAAQTVEGEVDATMRLPGYKPTTKGHSRQIQRAAEAINGAERPVLYVGGGVISSGASEELRAIARRGCIPVTTTLMGLGSFPETDPLSLGMLGMHGTAFANFAVMNCDLLIAVGARFDDRITGNVAEFARQAAVIHVDVDPASIGKSISVDIPVVGDAKAILEELVPLIEPRDRSEWHERIARWKEEYPLSYKSEGEIVKPQAVVEAVYEVTKGNAVICTDVGQHQMWAAQYYLYDRPRSFVSSGGLGTMGFGLPAAIGAQFGRPGEVVFVIAGDGSLQMNIQEMSTAVYNKLPIKIALLNNGYLGMVRQWQELFYNRRYSHTYLAGGSPDFVKLAEAYGAVGMRIERSGEVLPAIRKAMEVKDVPVLMDFRVAPEENVFPMVPAGGAIDRMIHGLA
jgi:acetolactate synthase-1/2/3 large subunit